MEFPPKCSLNWGPKRPKKNSGARNFCPIFAKILSIFLKIFLNNFFCKKITKNFAKFSQISQKSQKSFPKNMSGVKYPKGVPKYLPKMGYPNQRLPAVGLVDHPKYVYIYPKYVNIYPKNVMWGSCLSCTAMQ